MELPGVGVGLRVVGHLGESDVAVIAGNPVDRLGVGRAKVGEGNFHNLLVGKLIGQEDPLRGVIDEVE